MRILNISALSLVMLALAGCGSMDTEGKRVDYKSATVKVPSLEIPPDLTAPGVGDRYAIPDSGEETVASYSDFAKGGTPQARANVTVLPEAKNVRLERNGSLHWLVVADRAENLWTPIKAFWQEKGFIIKTENPQAGIIETDWAENRAKIPKGGLRSVIGKVFDNLYDSGERDMYRTRLERSKDGSSTEIYISYYGKEEVLDKNANTSKWQPRPNDPEMEIAMLQMLMAKLGGEAEAQTKAQGAPAESARKTVAAPRLQTLADGNKIILLSEPFDKSWRNVGLALERAGMVVEDKDRAKGVYFVRVAEAAREKGWLDKLAFWRNEDSAKPVRYQVTVHEGSTDCEVAATNVNGESTPLSQRIIDVLYQNLPK
ncbi:MAG: outer membrane protein assembly factor BamC [Betaproteobacteria bacterium]|nr:outer membrane protein assembly factor BamC [Betaproteobacteria bacterium]